MKKVYCDVCGQEMTDGTFSTDPREKDGILDLTGMGDVCFRCEEIGRRIDIKTVLLEHWKRRATTQKQEETE